MIAGVVGRTEQALREARTAVGLGYHAGLLSLAAFKGAGADEIIDHCRRVAEEIPLVGFYLQPAVGGIHLDADFWRRFCEIENVVAIKVAPFNRYRTLDVVRGLVAAGAEDRIALYTGNDDHIVLDLVTPFVAMRDGKPVTVRFRGGLLGHWSVWTKAAVDLLAELHAAIESGKAARRYPGARFARDRLQRRVLRRRERFPRLHRRVPRGAAAAGACSKASGASTRTKD